VPILRTPSIGQFRFPCVSVDVNVSRLGYFPSLPVNMYLLVLSFVRGISKGPRVERRRSALTATMGQLREKVVEWSPRWVAGVKGGSHLALGSIWKCVAPLAVSARSVTLDVWSNTSWWCVDACLHKMHGSAVFRSDSLE
jgi:hypothetical protein